MLTGYIHMVDFFTAFDWWNYRPFNQAVDHSACCLAKPDQIYLVYFRAGGRTTVRLGESQYQGRWFNPRTGEPGLPENLFLWLALQQTVLVLHADEP